MLSRKGEVRAALLTPTTSHARDVEQVGNRGPPRSIMKEMPLADRHNRTSAGTLSCGLVARALVSRSCEEFTSMVRRLRDVEKC
jgi:hypothetical protein